MKITVPPIHKWEIVAHGYQQLGTTFQKISRAYKPSLIPVAEKLPKRQTCGIILIIKKKEYYGIATTKIFKYFWKFLLCTSFNNKVSLPLKR